MLLLRDHERESASFRVPSGHNKSWGLSVHSCKAYGRVGSNGSFPPSGCPRSQRGNVTLFIR